MRVVFMGTPDIAATCLQGLLEQSFDVVGVFTKPDKPVGRHRVMTMSAVKELALAHNLPVYQPDTLRDGQAEQLIRELSPDVIAVVAYGKLLPSSILKLPRLGCVNIHASLLPALRGSGPVQWSILNGLDETGVTAMFMAEGMDTGDIIDVRKTPIAPLETTQELMNRLTELGKELLPTTLRNLEAGTFTRTVQDEAKATYAPMLSKELCPIDWSKTRRQIVDQVRGLNPWPIATAELGGTKFKIYDVRPVDRKSERPAGTPLTLTNDGLEVACGDGVILIRRLQAEGGKQMAAADYFRGHAIALG